MDLYPSRIQLREPNLTEIERTQKRAKKAAADKAKAAAPPATPKQNAPKPKEKIEEPTIDPDAMFKQGFLDDVYKERPVKPVVTRFPPEPNGKQVLLATLPWFIPSLIYKE